LRRSEAERPILMLEILDNLQNGVELPQAVEGFSLRK
jgi:hypothetical protein